MSGAPSKSPPPAAPSSAERALKAALEKASKPRAAIDKTSKSGADRARAAAKVGAEKPRPKPSVDASRLDAKPRDFAPRERDREKERERARERARVRRRDDDAADAAAAAAAAATAPDKSERAKSASKVAIAAAAAAAAEKAAGAASGALSLAPGPPHAAVADVVGRLRAASDDAARAALDADDAVAYREDEYINATWTHGNLMRGWDSYVRKVDRNPKTSVESTGGVNKQRKVRVIDRIFSLTSRTSTVRLENAVATEAAKKGGVKKKIAKRR